MKNKKTLRQQIIIKGFPRMKGKVRRHENPIIFRVYDLPREIMERNLHRIEWILARFRYFNPHLKVDTSFSNYYNISPESLLKSKLSAAKGQLTKLEKAMDMYKESWQPTLLQDSIDTDEYWNRATIKKFERQQQIKKLEKELNEKAAESKPSFC